MDGKTEEVVFPSKRDQWVVAVFGTTAAIEVVSALTLVVAGPPALYLKVALPILLLLSAVIIFWCIVGTSYRVLPGELVIRSGPFASHVPIAAITSVTPVHNSIAAPALSSDRLELQRAPHGRALLVSPEEPMAFIAALQQVNAAIAVVGQVSPRA